MQHAILQLQHAMLLMPCELLVLTCGICWSMGFSLVEVHRLEFTEGSVVVEHGLSCPMACEILVPQLGIELKTPALEGRFFFFF